MKKPAQYETQQYVEAASAATEVGADDYDGSAPEGAAIVSLFLAAIAVLAALGAAHVLAHFLSNA